MIRGGFLSDAERQSLIAMARDGLAEHRIARRANAIVLLDKGWSCARVAGALLLDDDTVRDWFQAHGSGGLDGLSRFGHDGSSGRSTRGEPAAAHARSGYCIAWPATPASLTRCPAASMMSGTRPSSQATRSFST